MQRRSVYGDTKNTRGYRQTKISWSRIRVHTNLPLPVSPDEDDELREQEILGRNLITITSTANSMVTLNASNRETRSLVCIQTFMVPLYIGNIEMKFFLENNGKKVLQRQHSWKKSKRRRNNMIAISYRVRVESFVVGKKPVTKMVEV